MMTDSAPVPDDTEEFLQKMKGQHRKGKKAKAAEKAKLDVSNHADAAEWLRKEVGKGKLSGLFRRDGYMVHTPAIGESGYIEPKPGDANGPAQVHPIDVNVLKAKIEMEYEVGSWKKEGDEWKWKRSLCPLAVATNVHSSARGGFGTDHLRPLRGISHTPFLRSDGSVCSRPGFDEISGIMYLPDPDLFVPAIPADPTKRDVRAARDLLLEPIAQFPFVSDESRSNWLGLLFTPLLKPMFPPPYQMGIVNAPSPGSGKSYLAKMLRVVHGGVLRSELPRDAAEMEKSLASILHTTTAPVITFDNVRGQVKSSVLEGMLTTLDWGGGRVLGATQVVNLSNDRIWMITSNNASIGGDLARRSIWITIDPKMPNPHRRKFAFDPVQMVTDRRGEIIAAILTIARAWVLDGAESAPTDRSDGYAHWTAGIGGILRYAGLGKGFGAGADVEVQSDDDAEWGAFLAALYEVVGPEPFTAKEVVRILAGTDADGRTDKPSIDFELVPSALSSKVRHKWEVDGNVGFTKSLGKWFGNRSGRYFDGMTAEKQPQKSRKHALTFKIVKYGKG